MSAVKIGSLFFQKYSLKNVGNCNVTPHIVEKIDPWNITFPAFIYVDCWMIVVANPVWYVRTILRWNNPRFFVFFYILLNLICLNFNIFAFSAVVAIHLTLHNPCVNWDFTIAENLWLAENFHFFKGKLKKIKMKNKRKFSNQLSGVVSTSTYFTKCRSSCSEVLYGKFKKFLGTHPSWSTKLVKFQAFIPKFK